MINSIIKPAFRRLIKPYLSVIGAKLAELTTPRKYIMTMNAEHATVSKNNFADRTYLMTLGVFGFVHLDFTTTDTPAKFDELGVF
ncbi:MAG: hypothetical protein KGV56_03210, partial [Gammaproteobacteria bacterium]|nr:hypothetical protein [Gammaproteobacteria bacterium]